MLLLPKLLNAAQNLVDQSSAKGLKIATAESCTGGLIAAYITSISGSSEVFGYGVVTYSEKAKADMLGIPMRFIHTHGAVSYSVAEAMAKNILKLAGADYAIGVTGIAGPKGGTLHLPVGTVFIALASKASEKSVVYNLEGTREEVRQQAVQIALTSLTEAVARH